MAFSNRRTHVKLSDSIRIFADANSLKTVITLVSKLIFNLLRYSVMPNINWSDILDNISLNESTEHVISHRFVEPLLQALGFNHQEQRPEFKTGSRGGDKVDFACRHIK
ncbi:MAG: hypothetical protein ACR2LR_06295 [Hassallia sp.]